jgi:hypothetical protein
MISLGPPTHPESDGPGEVAALLMGPAALLFLECKALEKRTLRSLLRAKLGRWTFCGSHKLKFRSVAEDFLGFLAFIAEPRVA